MQVSSRLSAALLLFSLSCLAVADPNRFESPTAGIAFSEPDSWQFVSMQATLENRDKVRLDDAELERQVKTQANPPLAIVLPTMAKAQADFQIVAAAAETTVGGLPAAR